VEGLAQTAAIRGPDPSETLIDIDGHQVNNANTGDFDLELMDPEEFSGVQIVYGIGPSSLAGANTQGGAINFRTIDPTAEDRGLLRFSAGSFGTFAETLQTTGTDGALGYALSWHHFTTQGEVNRYPIMIDSSGTIADVGSGIDAISSLAKFRYSFDSGFGFAEVTYRNTTASRDLSAALSTPDNPAAVQPGSPFTLVHAPGAAALTVSPAYGLDVQVPAGQRDASGSYASTLIARHLTEVSSQSTTNISTNAALFPLNPYLLDDRDRVDDDSIEFDRDVGNATLTLLGDVRSEKLSGPLVYVSGPTSQAQTQRSFVARDVWSSTPHLHYTTALYLSRYDTFGTSIDPRVALVWTPSATAVLRASAGTGFRAPLLTERAYNPNLTAERTTEYELGYEMHVGAGATPMTAAVNLYRTNLRNPIFFTTGPSGQFTFLANLGHVVYQGAELRLDAPLGAGTAAHASYGVDIAYPVDNPFAFDAAAPNVVAGEQFQGIPPHKALLALDHRGATGTSFGVDASYESLDNELNRPAYVLFDASAARKFGNTQVALSVLNLTNRFDDKFTLPNAGTPYPIPGGFAPTNALSLQGRTLTMTLTETL